MIYSILGFTNSTTRRHLSLQWEPCIRLPTASTYSNIKFTTTWRSRKRLGSIPAQTRDILSPPSQKKLKIHLHPNSLKTKRTAEYCTYDCIVVSSGWWFTNHTVMWNNGEIIGWLPWPPCRLQRAWDSLRVPQSSPVSIFSLCNHVWSQASPLFSSGTLGIWEAVQLLGL